MAITDNYRTETAGSSSYYIFPITCCLRACSSCTICTGSVATRLLEGNQAECAKCPERSAFVTPSTPFLEGQQEGPLARRRRLSASASFRFVSFRFVSFRFVSFRFISFRFVSVWFGSFCPRRLSGEFLTASSGCILSRIFLLTKYGSGPCRRGE